MNIVYLQSGGPTAQINRSLSGALLQAKRDGIKMLGSLYGVEGLLRNQVVDLSTLSEEDIERLARTPGAALRSSRKSMVRATPEEWTALGVTLVANHIDAILVNGGNDSMLTALTLHQKLYPHGIRVIGVPKTVDNDLFGIDFAPGYLTAANYVANSVQNIILDSRVYQKGKVTLIETMGRETGWLAASALVLKQPIASDGVFLPETPMDMNRFIHQAAETYAAKGTAFYVFAEGVAQNNGEAIDSFGNRAVEGCCDVIAEQLTKEAHLPVRVVRLSIPQRSCANYPSQEDDMISAACGRFAVELVRDGKSDLMAGYREQDNGWVIRKEIPLEEVGGKTRFYEEAKLSLLQKRIHVPAPFVIEE